MLSATEDGTFGRERSPVQKQAYRDAFKGTPPNGSFPKQGGPDIDPEILYSSLYYGDP